MKHDFNSQLKEDEKTMGNKDSFYRIKEGNNNLIRVLTPGMPYVQFFLGQSVPPAVCYGEKEGDPRIHNDDLQKSTRYSLYILDREDGEVKLATLPYSVVKSIGNLQKNPDYTFDEVPMPYDIRITYYKDEAPANKYKVDATPNTAPLTDEEQKKLTERMEDITPEQFVEKLKEKQKNRDIEDGVWVSPEQKKENYENLVARQEPQQQQKSNTIEYPKENIKPEDIPF